MQGELRANPDRWELAIPGKQALGDLDRQLSGADMVDGLARPGPVRWRDAQAGPFGKFLPAGGIVTAGSVHHRAEHAPMPPDPGDRDPHLRLFPSAAS